MFKFRELIDCRFRKPSIDFPLLEMWPY